MVRPPLVGQASSSSNESRQSLSSGAEDIIEDRNVSSFLRGPGDRLSDPVSINTGDYYVDNSNRQFSHYISNREDYINAKPPEGSSDHSLVSVNTAEPSSDGGPRIPSPASSVTSGRKLEWDSGADVGYQQNYAENIHRLDPVLSTIERLAIVQGTALLTRSDPEGTTEPSIQPVKTIVKPKNKIKEIDSVGLPKAQSTPFSTFLPNENTIGRHDLFSPIATLNNQMSVQDPICEESSKSPKRSNKKYSLFPELKTSKDAEIYNSRSTENVPHMRANQKNTQEFSDLETKNSSKNSTLRSSVTSSPTVSPNKTTNSLGKPICHSVISDLKDRNMYLLKYPKKDESNFVNCNKKLSSSLEDVRDIDNFTIGSTSQRNTLPRSQSQNNIFSDKDEKISSNVEVKCHLTNMVVHNFPFTTNKSASSSSVATVVHKKHESPLHFPKVVQTSLLKQSIVTQSCEQPNHIDDSKSGSRSLLSSEARSNYFMYKLNRTDNGQSDNCKENMELHLQKCHKGIFCKGAHERVGSDVESYQALSKLASDNPNQSTSAFQISKNTKYQESTLGSIESSSKSRGFSTDRQGSMAAEDRVNSFEYLPGYVYENEKHLSSHSTSSISAHHKHSSGNIDNLWETDQSVNLSRDINRGVEIIKDVVRSKSTSNKEMKKRVIQLVVEKLINTNYAEDDFKSININDNIPWIPPVLEKRISDNKYKSKEKSKVPGELSSLTDSSRGTSNTSSECFKPKPPGILRDIDMHKLQCHDKCIGTGDSLTSTSYKARTVSQTNTSTESTEPQVLSNTKRISSSVVKEKCSLESTSTSSLKYDKRNWKSPVTKAEQIYEQRRKLQKEKSKSSTENSRVVKFLDLEKKTQLMRIDIEMQHLNNLRKLLSKTEELKENMKDLRKSRTLDVKQTRSESDTKYSSKMKFLSSPCRRKMASKQYKPDLQTWLNEAKSVPKSTGCDKAMTKSQGIRNDWSSHHYLSEDCQSVKEGSMKSKQVDRIKIINSQLKNKSIGEQTSASSAVKTSRSKQSHNVPTESVTTCNKIRDGESSSAFSNILRRRNLQDDLASSEGVQTSKSSEQKIDWKDVGMSKCRCHTTCRCCKENRCFRNEKKTKQPVGYYITLQPEIRSEQSAIEKPSLEEVTIHVPVETKNRIMDKPTSSSESEVLSKHHKPTLQDYLVENRPDYIHRANDRRQCIAQLTYLRELRDQSKRRLLALSQPTVPKDLPPPPLAIKRVFTQKRMRQQTERKYKQLSEVQWKQQDTKRKEAYRTNRLMAEVFTKKLQRRVLKGEVNLSNSMSVITSL